MITNLQAFQIRSCQILAASQTSASATVNKDEGSVRITNTGPNTAFIRMGTGAQTAVLTDMPILANTSVHLKKSISTDTIAAICAATQTASLYIAEGNGGI
jgi:hypothetical protein